MRLANAPGGDAVLGADEDVAQDVAPAEQALERRVGDEAVGAVDRRRPLDLAADAQPRAEHADEVADADREPLGERAVEHDLAGAGPLAGDEVRQRAAADDGDDAALVAGLDVAALVEDARRRGDAGDTPNRCAPPPAAAPTRSCASRRCPAERRSRLRRSRRCRRSCASPVPAKIAFSARTSRSASAIPTTPPSARPRRASNCRRATGTFQATVVIAGMPPPGRAGPGSERARRRRRARRRAPLRPSRRCRPA